jgi:HSP20 family protein
MTMLRTNFTDPVSLRNAVDSLFEQSFVRSSHTNGKEDPGRAMAINLYEKDDVYYLKAYLPGVKGYDVDISVDDKIINLKARIPSKLDSEDAKDYRWHISELGYGDVSRSVTFPVLIDAGSIEASQEDGILTVTVPKAEEAKPRQIKVKAVKKG